MKRVIGWVLCFSIAGSAVAASDKAVRKALEADYALFARAWQKKDLAPTYKLMTDDFTALGVGPNGKAVGKAQMIEQTKQLLAADHITWPRRILELKVSGKTAVAVVDGHFTGMMPDRSHGKPHKFEILAKTRDTWVLVGKEWKFKKIEIVSSTMKSDGKELKR